MTMKTTSAITLCRVGLVGLVACSDTPVNVQTASFERPGPLATFCLLEDGTPVSRARCSEGEGVLHALVAQTSRGEVAVLRLGSAPAVIDGDKRVPGYTYFATGETPVAVEVPDENPAYTFVANYGSRDLRVLDTEALATDAASTSAELSRFPLGDAPTSMVLTTDGATAILTQPTRGVLAVVRNDAGQLAAGADVVLAGAPVAPTRSIPEAEFEFFCPSPGPTLPTAHSQLTPDALGNATGDAPALAAEPSAIARDPDSTKIVVADASRALIYVVDLASMQQTAVIQTGRPTRALAVTPFVPATLNATTSEAKYIYAIDAVDSSVMVIDFAEASPTFGQLLVVDDVEGRASDRLSLAGAAESLAVLTPGFEEASCIDPDAAEVSVGPADLRGVYLAVGLSDGSVRVVDVYDLDAACRGGGLDCTNPAVSSDAHVYVRRHRARVGAYVASPNLLLSAPVFVVDGVQQRVANDGTALTGSITALRSLGACPQAVAFPDADALLDSGGTASPLICVPEDPWRAVAQQWTFTHGGTLPGSRGRLGRFSNESGTLRFVGAEANFCTAGVISANAAVTDSEQPEASPAGADGDVLVLGTMPATAAARPECSRLVMVASGGEVVPVELAITRATTTELQLGDATGQYRALLGAASISATTAEIAGCFDELVSYSVRVGDEGYLVSGARTGHLHRVTTADDGECVVDVSASQLHSGRAFAGKPFSNGALGLTLGYVPEVGHSAGLVLVTGQIATKLGFDLASETGRGGVPTGLSFSDADDRLYVSDATGAVFQIRLDNFLVERTFR